MQVTTIGLDLAKRVFQVHGVDVAGKIVLRRKLQRSEMAGFFADLPPCLIGIEACATAHHWARLIGKAGHDVRLIPPVPSEFAPMTGWGDFRAAGSGRCHDTEREKPMAKETSATGAGRCFLAIADTEVKEIPEFVVTSAEAIRRGGVTEPTHRTISALDPAMILFNSVIEILAGPVLHAVT
jgi:hypothetical protein